MSLTKTVVEKAKFEGHSYTDKHGREKFSRYVLWDDEVGGFGVRITPDGYKTFVLSYRAKGRKKLMTLGAFGRLTVDAARRKAKKEVAKVLDGRDPLEERREERRMSAAAKKMSELCDLYLELHASKKKASSQRADRTLIRCHVLPAMGTRRVGDVTQEDISRLHLARKSTPYQANRLLALLSKMFNLAEQWRYRPSGSNPCRGVKRFKEEKRKRFLSTDELQRLGKVLSATENEKGKKREHPSAILAIRLLLLTGARKTEILKVRWDEVDLKRRYLFLADSKTGEKTIPLSAAATKLLREANRDKDNPYVCPGQHKGKHLVGLSKIWGRIRQRAKLNDVRIHDLRHSFGAVGASGGLGLPVIGALLGHRVAQTTERYAHVAEDPLHEAAERISGEIAAALSKEQKSDARGEAV